MRRRTDGILTTHAGALQRPLALSKAMAEQGEWAPAVRRDCGTRSRLWCGGS
jgi:hypothetical protein